MSSGPQAYQREFIRFAMDREALLFGTFRTKAGRESPYFYNSGKFCDGESLSRLGSYYAAAIEHSGVSFDMLYGPAYKGIPLAVATATAMYQEHGRSVPWCFNRKEDKDHGEGGQTVGAPLDGRVLVVDDVVSSGLSVEESLEIIRAAGAQAVGVVMAVDRQERGNDSPWSATDQIARKHGLPVISILALRDLLLVLEESPELREHVPAIRKYHETWKSLR